MLNSFSNFFNPTEILKEIGVQEGMRIADFGAGYGYMSFAASNLVGNKGIVYALDVKKAVIEHIKNEIKNNGFNNIKPIWTNLELFNHNPIKSGSMDMVLIVNMLFQSNKHKEILEEAKRVLKTGGTITVIDWKKQATPFGPPIDERVDLEKLKQTAYNIGLNRIKEFEPGPYHFGILFKK